MSDEDDYRGSIAALTPNAAIDPNGFRSARNVIIAERKIERLAPMYCGATTDLPVIRAWATRWRDDPTGAPWLYLAGEVGTGKTHAAIAAVRMAVRAPRTIAWDFVTCAQLLENLRPGGPVGAEAAYREADLLVIDDLTLIKDPSEWVTENMARLIDFRRRTSRCTILTSNHPPRDLITRKLLPEQIVSRIGQSCTVVTMTGVDRRRGGAS